uniref:Uncharacterized protein n=1 Tax=viral metagenome TaxID=1070528 RepID=A0A6C0KMR1_9ZZZZ
MENQQTIVEKYIEQMTPEEKIAYNIAKKNLESSFDIEKSIGFLEFKKKQSQI